MIKINLSFYKLFFFLIPTIYVFRYIITNNKEDIYTLIFMFIIIAGIVYRVLNFVSTDINVTPSTLYCILYLIYICVSMLWLEYKFMIFSGISLIIIYISILIISNLVITKNKLLDVYAGFSFGILFISTLFKIFSFLYPENFRLIDNRFGWFYVNGHVVSDPNLYAVFIAISIPYFIIKIFKSKNKYLYLILLLFMLYFLITTLSRGVMLAFLISSFITYTVWILRRDNYIRSYIFYQFLLISILLIIIFLINNSAYYLSDINYKSVERYLLFTTSERLPLWSSIIAKFFNEELRIILFGNGFQSGSILGAIYYYGNDYNPDSIKFKNPHNMFIQSLIETGLFGLAFLVFIILILLLHVIVSVRKNHYLPLFLFALFITTNLSLNVMGFRELSFIFGILLVSSLKGSNSTFAP